MDSKRSDPSRGAAMPLAVKILVAGGFGVGKTSMVGAVSEIRPLRTEEQLTDRSVGIDDTSGVERKTTTTVAMDFGRITIRDGLVLYLFGTPGQDRFWFMWDELALGALGAVVLTGLLVARRTAGDLDLLVEGSLAAARGDLEHRVPVRAKDEVGAVASAFNFMMEDLRTAKDRLVIAERIAAWQEIARRLAHEIKNPLTPIQMAMDTLRKSYKKQHPEFPEILEESTRTVLEEADRLKKIVAEFSDFARMPKPELARMDLNEVIRSALSLYQGGSVKIDMKLAKDLPEIDGDKGQLTQVLLNLVENARDAIGSREDGHITITTKKGDANDRTLLIVEDNGPGVPAELKDKVFAPYFTTKQTKGGTGLGLAIVHRIVSDHGGRITISDARDRGARFAIELPLRSGAALLASRI
jgi:two-component system, NtrC family, nitrogen regulation sensor histidine kinase NtrY